MTSSRASRRATPPAIRRGSSPARRRSGQYLSGGTISSFTINGALIDSVLAASVAPYGGDGSLPPPVPYGGTPRTSGAAPRRLQQLQRARRRDRPGQRAGDQELLDPLVRQRPALPTAVYDTAIDPNIHVNVLEGGTIIATVTGGVVSTPHDDSFDFTGVFAVNTLGVNGGLAPAP